MKSQFVLQRLRSAFAGLCLLTVLPISARAADLQVGVAEVEITPPVPYRMAGYFSERLSTGTHDPLMAKTLVFKQGTAQGAIVICDLIAVSAELTGNARRQASEKTGIPAENILIAATHSHTGPLFDGALREHFHEQSVAQQGSDVHEKVDYPALLTQRLVEVIERAARNARPAELNAGKTTEDTLSFNRRFHMKDGKVVFNPGKLNPNIVRVAGPIDPEVGLLAVVDPQTRKTAAVLTVFALHLDTVGGTQNAADYPYYLQQALRSGVANDVVSLFGIGTCGDINHVNVNDGKPQKGGEETERIGARLGRTVLEALPRLAAVTAPRLAIRSVRVRVPLQKVTGAEIARARADLFKVGTNQLSFLDQVNAYRVMMIARRKTPDIPLEVQVFRLNKETAIVGIPGEVFVELGLAIKRGSPFGNTLVVELCNDIPSYIPTKQAFSEGSYETVNSMVEPGGGEQMVETAVQLLKELHATD